MIPVRPEVLVLTSAPAITSAPGRRMSGQHSTVVWLVACTIACATSEPDASLKFATPATAALARAAAANDSSLVRQLIRAGAHPNDPGDSGITVLQWAMRHQATRGVSALLAGGADPNQPDITGRTAVHYAALDDDSTYLAMVLNAGANPNARRPAGGNSPLDDALLYGENAQFRMLLAAGANPNLPNVAGDTPLHIAAQINAGERVLDLLRAGANPALRDRNGHTFQLFFNMTPDNVASSAFRQQRAAVNDWLRQHNVALEGG